MNFDYKKIDVLKHITSREFVETYCKNNEPVVIENFNGHWPAIKKWDSEYLIDHIGDEVVLCSQSKNEKHPDFHSFTKNGQVPLPMKFSEYIAKISGDDDLVNSRIALNRIVFEHGAKTSHRQHLKLGSLANDINMPTLLSRNNLEVGVIWIQGKRTQSWLHTDPYENLYTQVQGTKRLLLMHPEESSNVYNNRKYGGYCEVDAFEPDLKQFPDFEKASIYEVILNPGDLLYIPAFWFHAVESLGAINVTVNWWYRPEKLYCSPGTMYFLLEKMVNKLIQSENDPLVIENILSVVNKLHINMLDTDSSLVSSLYTEDRKSE